MADLLKCTLKKSQSVLWKLILYASYLIDGVAAIAVVLYGLINIGLAIAPAASAAWSGLVNAATTQPWWVYWVIFPITGIVASVVLYSFAWCVARELAEEDWKSEIAENGALALALALTAPTALAAFAFALAADNSNYGKWHYFAIRFIGAYLHYRSRINGGGKPE